jgi:RHS repeat-associated protein
MVTDINPSITGTGPGSLTVANNALFFTADNGTAGVELWQSDGTATGTMIVAGINAGSAGADVTNLRSGAGRLFFGANDGTHGQELWTSLGSNRVVQYGYDGLQRLSSTAETPGTSYAYAYDDAGNRTGVWLNGTRTVTQTYNAANQVNGFSYDAAGNLTNDGTAAYTYDALGRMIVRGTTPYTYTGDGVLVFDGTTRYTQDLAAPLSQVLQTTQGSATTQYVYGRDRLAAVAGSTRTWYVGDGLGSVRVMLSDSGAPLGVVHYDPWGTVETGTVPTFGFTGELQDVSSGLVNLRARWYQTGQGRFVSRDPFAGMPETPYSQHPYAYALSNPVRYTDPTGKYFTTGTEELSGCPNGYVFDPTQYHATRAGCIPVMLDTTPPNWYPWDIGIIVGFSGTCSAGAGALSGGVEYVIDLYDFEANVFGNLGGGVAIGASATAYVGLVAGWSSFKNPGVANYKGFAGGVGVSGTGNPLTVQGGASKPSDTGGQLWAFSVGGSAGASAKINGSMMQSAIDTIAKITPAVGSFNVATYFTAEDAGEFAKAHTGVDLNLHSTQQTFHRSNGAHPTMHDAGNLSMYVAGLALKNPIFATIVPFVSIVSAYNATAWQMQDDWARRHANATK